MTTNLKWGETPFDKMTPDEMRLLLCKFYSALQSTRSVLSTSEAMQKALEAAHPFWGADGVGGRALAKANQALDPIEAEFGGNEAIVRAFFRYADDLLFDCSKYYIGSNWAICPKCKVMIGTARDQQNAAGTSCAGTRRGGGCDGILRKIEWADLRPEESSP